MRVGGRPHVPELEQLEALIGRLGPRARTEVLARVAHHGRRLPIYAVVLGARDRSAPTLALVGGVHGLERIGTQVVLAWLHTLTELLEWDEVLARALEHTRLVFVPLLNPWGFAKHTRGNARGVDLMRNAPSPNDARGSFLVGGQRLSPRLPWYMGEEDAPMEPEATALCEIIEREVFGARTALALDCHSGFGFQDRVWFPYARTRKPFPHLGEVHALKYLLDATLPHHVYRIEPQALSYTVRGDLWDHLYDRHRALADDQLFVPLTLEMGSWIWVKKNPRQVFSALGSFNPVKPHRLRRTLRRHLSLFDFLFRAVASAGSWLPRGDDERRRLEDEAFELWYTR
ncbi:MAG TPA: DUF2817 domain-containing protein [Sandaracinaceae bacterium LLY-WYZ-13_1]|nr:DUF2817 domain-containing protein [Sandaracinaceae bacterium LLY-WYZ-13_1]